MTDKLEYPPELVAKWAELREAARSLKWIHLEPIASPTFEQIQIVKAHFPDENALAIRRRLSEGNARIGPFEAADVPGFAGAALDPHGLKYQIENANDDDLDAMGLDSLS